MHICYNIMYKIINKIMKFVGSDPILQKSEYNYNSMLPKYSSLTYGELYVYYLIQIQLWNVGLHTFTLPLPSRLPGKFFLNYNFRLYISIVFGYLEDLQCSAAGEWLNLISKIVKGVLSFGELHSLISIGVTGEILLHQQISPYLQIHTLHSLCK
jgi:hypothetical protein